jgi:hypothetical protein
VDSLKSRLDLIHLSDVASELKVHPETLRRVIRKHKVPMIRIGRYKYVSVEAFRRILSVYGVNTL